MTDFLEDRRDLCARNLSAAYREAANAHLAARSGGTDEDLTADLIARACELLARALKRLMIPRPEARPEAETPVPAVPATPAGAPPA